MKTFESLFAELSEKAATKQAGSLTVDELAKGTHFIGKKIVEEAGETWIAAEYEGADRTAEEMSQLIYHLQVMMIDRGITLLRTSTRTCEKPGAMPVEGVAFFRGETC